MPVRAHLLEEESLPMTAFKVGDLVAYVPYGADGAWNSGRGLYRIARLGTKHLLRSDLPNGVCFLAYEESLDHVCAHCKMLHRHHADHGKCLYTPTYWKELTTDDPHGERDPET